MLFKNASDVTCNVTVHCSVPNTSHCISGEKTATSPPFYLPSLTANDPVVKNNNKKTSNLQDYCHFAADSNLQKCCCLMELLLVALSGCSLCFRDHSVVRITMSFWANLNCLLFPSNWLPFFNYTVFHTAQPRLSHSHYQPFSPHTLLFSRATVNSHACGNDGFCTVVKHSSG